MAGVISGPLGCVVGCKVGAGGAATALLGHTSPSIAPTRIAARTMRCGWTCSRQTAGSLSDVEPNGRFPACPPVHVVARQETLLNVNRVAIVAVLCERDTVAGRSTSMSLRWRAGPIRPAGRGLLLASGTVLLLALRSVHGHQPPTESVSATSTTRPATVDELAPSQASLPPTATLVSGLVGSKHDFRRLNAEVRDLCLPCHVPHLTVAPVPRLDRRPTTTQPLRPYARPDVELSGWSLLCLGCHDGVTASDVYTSSHAATVSGPLRRSTLGTRGLRSHPVGVQYPSARPDYHPAAAVTAGGLPLPDGRIQCTTCHDPHNTRGYDGFLRISNQRSALCLACHRL